MAFVSGTVSSEDDQSREQLPPGLLCQGQPLQASCLKASFLEGSFCQATFLEASFLQASFFREAPSLRPGQKVCFK